MGRLFSAYLCLLKLAFVISANPGAIHKNVGALYVMNNEPSGNFLLTHDILADGTVTFSRTTPTGGNGLHGLTLPNVTHVDGLFGAGSIQVAGDFLFIVNPGSDTVSMFAINPKLPSQLTMVGKPVNTEGDYPMSIAVSKQTGNICVLNGGHVNGVKCFTVNKTHGLQPLAGTRRLLDVNQTTPPSGPANALSHIIFSEDGKKLIVAAKGTFDTLGFLAAWDVHPDGTLSSTYGRTQGAGLFPFQMALIEGTKHIFNADAGFGFAIYDYSQSNIAPFTAYNVTPNGAICWLAFSKKTQTYFMTDLITSIITEVKVDRNLSASVVNQYTPDEHAGTIDAGIATIGSNDYLYVLGANITSIEVLALDGPGKAKNLQTYNFTESVTQAGVVMEANNLQGMATYIIS